MKHSYVSYPPRLVVCCFAILLYMAPSLAKRTDDVVVLKNGDHLTGEIKSLQRGELRFKSSYMAEAVRLVGDKRQPDGTWLLENTHPGETPFELEDGDGRPSRWNTLRALRVLGWYDAGR